MRQLESSIYRMRLKNEYEDVMKLNHPGNKMFTIAPAPGETVPFVSKYDLVYHGDTWVMKNNHPVRQRGLTVRINLYRDFPYSAPHTYAVSDVPFHTNWWVDGHICNGVAWTVTGHLDEYVRFVIEVLQFRPERINPNSAANSQARDWWLQRRHDGSCFPSDRTAWPGKRIAPRLRFV